MKGLITLLIPPRAMMTSADRSLEDILYGRQPHGNGPETGGCRGDGDATQNVCQQRATPSHDGHAPSLQEPILCAGCGGRVVERFFLLAAGRAWHGACLRCCQCHRELETSPSLYWRGGNTYCQQDYCRLFVIGRCARCQQPIPSTAMVMRSGELTFHPHCFSCQECDITLLPGNLYFLQGRSLYCQSHYHGNTPHNTASGKEGEESASSPESRLDDRGESVAGGRVRRQNKRIRTCFRSEQLRALESYFAQKHNPDGKDWTCLAHKTGLPKRVLQVWFQNARAKMRRSVSVDDSPTASRAETVATSPPSLSRSPLYSTSTIDQSQLSLLTNPLDVPPPADQSGGSNHSFLLDYNSQGAPGWTSPLGRFQEGDEPMGREGLCDDTLRHFYS
ncbi:LIM/homeobox protein Lhx9 isoform X1 [Gadus morhua]|uniref:LIM/homeobox protein Lhx9 isoform X1 n=2 Tax=Gadus morhua TaxID=8049 RepID=UPI0011B5DDF8|nr:LIM/homeobox protein Lhx9-like isoform X1 [Gadus morhua]